MKLIKRIWTTYFEWLTEDKEDLNVNPIKELERRLLTQRHLYEKNSNNILHKFIDQEIQRASLKCDKWRMHKKNKAVAEFLLKITSIPFVLYNVMSLFVSFNSLFVPIIVFQTIIIIIFFYWSYLYAINPNEHEKNFDDYLQYLSKFKDLKATAIYKNLDEKNPANYHAIFRSKLTQAEICKLFLENFDLIREEGKRNYYRPFIDFTINYITDKEGKRFNTSAFQSEFSRELSNKTD